MAKTIISATEVQQAAPSGFLNVPAHAIITPLARELADELGVTITQAGQSGSGHYAPTMAGRTPVADDDLAGRIRAIVAPLLSMGGGSLAASTPARKPVKLTKLTDAKLEPFPYPGPPADMKVESVDVVTAEDGSPVAAGYMSLTKGSFPWTLHYDEVQIVLEGELHLGGDAGGKIGRPGDIFYVPKESSITFGTPSWAKFIYVTFPANWEEQIG